MRFRSIRVPWLRTGSAFACLLILLSSCTSGPRARHRAEGDGNANGGKPSSASGPSQGSGDTYGPPTPDQQQVVYGPEPMQLRPLALVFGPGMARGYAHIGALRALAEKKVPISAVYGMEMGSLIAAVYAMDPNINHFEWAMLRFKDEMFTHRNDNLLKRFFDRGDGSQKLEEQLKRLFGNKDISDAKIPLRIAIQEKNSSLPRILDKGPLVPALRAALAVPGVFMPSAWEGHPAQAALGLNAAAALCDEARAQGGSPVVLIDGGPTRDDVRSADILIRPNLSGMGEGDFQKKTDAAFSGKKAVEDKMEEIRRWVGMPNDTVSMNQPLTE